MLHSRCSLIDDGPKMLTDLCRGAPCEPKVVSAPRSTSSAVRHFQVEKMVIERRSPRRALPRYGTHTYVILIDSIPARPPPTTPVLFRPSFKLLNLRLGPDPRRRRQRPFSGRSAFFGAARNIEEGGSLTIIATARMTRRMTSDLLRVQGHRKLRDHPFDRKDRDRRCLPGHRHPALRTGRSSSGEPKD